jgi:16S rRNA (guanine527-N7)-methyltransferase
MTDSRETQSSYKLYFDFLQEWSVNSRLVQPRTLDDFYSRHIEDSKQIIPHISDMNKSILDIGTGAGFPGIVLSIEGFANVHLCEPDKRKVLFLEELVRKLNIHPIIHGCRVEELTDCFDIVTSRAFTSLDILLLHFSNVSHETSMGIFLKGKSWREEVQSAKDTWDFELEVIPSTTGEGAAILKVQSVHRKG